MPAHGRTRGPINAFIASMDSAVTTNYSDCQWTKYGGASRYGFDFDFVMPITKPGLDLGDVAGTATTMVREMTTFVSVQLQSSLSDSLSAATVSAPQNLMLQRDAYNHEDTPLSSPRGLGVFLCHASEDKESARELHSRLLQDGFDPWLDEAKLLPGQEWETEIQRAVRGADVVLVCLSTRSIDKKGYVQREIRTALDAADERPQESIFVIPACIEQCRVPERLSRWQRVDLYAKNGYDRLCLALDAVRIHER